MVRADTIASGVFLVTIHHAEDLSAQDSNGSSDPYIVVAYAKFGKPLYSTRIVLGDLNPVYEGASLSLFLPPSYLHRSVYPFTSAARKGELAG